MAYQSQRITLKEAALLSGYHPDYLSALIRSGKLWGEKVGKTWVTTREDLKKYIDECGVSQREITSLKTVSRFSLGVPGFALLVAVISLVAFITYVSVSGSMAVSRTSLSSSDAFDRSDRMVVPLNALEEDSPN